MKQAAVVILPIVYLKNYGWHSLVVNPAEIHRKGKERHTRTHRIDVEQVISKEKKVI